MHLVAVLALVLAVLVSPSRVLSQYATSIYADYVITNASGPAHLPRLGQYTMQWMQFPGNDVPVLPVSLPFSFPYWSSTVNTVYLNPNGAVQMDSSSQCCVICPQGQCCAFMNYDYTFSSGGTISSICSFSQSYYNMLALSLTDLNPLAGGLVGHGYSNAGVTVVNGTRYYDPDTPYIIVYNNTALNYYTPITNITRGLSPASEVRYTFGAGLYPTGRIDYYYWNVSDPVQYGQYNTLRLWLVGLRQSSGQSQQNANYVDYIDPNLFTLPTNGTYLPRASVKSNTTFTFWPIGSSVCASPPYSITEGGIVLRIVVKDYWNSTQRFRWQCQFTAKNGSVIGVREASVFSDNDEIQCLTPGYNSTTNATVTVSLLADGVMLPTSPLTLLYINGTSTLAAQIQQPPSSLVSLTLFCNQCTSFRPALCWTDCAGVLHGSAYFDTCGTCVGGTTGRAPGALLDCNGVCGGPFQSIAGECVCPSNNNQCLNAARQPSYVASLNSQYITATPASAASVNFPSTEPTLSFADGSFTPLANFNASAGLVRVALPFTFPYFTLSITSVLVSPAGALVFSYSNSACGITNFPSSVFDTSNGCVYQLIAGYLTQFDPTNSNATYSIVSRRDIFAVRFSNLRLLAAPTSAPLLSFVVSLYPTGRVSLDYQSWVPPAQLSVVSGLSGTRRVLIGLVTAPRALLELTTVWPSPLLPSSGGNVTGLYALQVEQQWRSTLYSSGVFMQVASMNGTGAYHFIPFPINLCLTPYFGSSAGNQLVHVNAALNSPYLSSLNLSCMIGTTRVPAVYNPTFGSLDCFTPASRLDSVAVAVGLMFETSRITMNRAYYYYYSPSNSAVDPQLYAYFYTTTGICNQCYVSSLSVNTNYCYLDCDYTWRGTAYRDDCGTCVGGVTGLAANAYKDCYGTCYGSHYRATVPSTQDLQCTCFIAQRGLAGCLQLPVPSPPVTTPTQYIDTMNTASGSGSGFSDSGSVVLSFTESQSLIGVSLPFTFLYYGLPVRHLYIGDTGAIYVSNASHSCLNQSFNEMNSADALGAADCFLSLIAPSLASYDVSQAVIAYQFNDTALLVRWRGLIETTTSRVYDFAVTLTSDASIRFYYATVSDPQSVNGNGSGSASPTWLVGLRYGVASSTLLPFPFFYTASSFPNTCSSTCTYASLPWVAITPNERDYLPETPFPSGYYVERAQFANDTGVTLRTVTFCPLSTASCLSPKSGLASGNTSVVIINTGIQCTDGSCCAYQLNMSCNFGGLATKASYDSAVPGWRCRSPAGIANSIVMVWLEESGRRIGSTTTLTFQYLSTINASSLPVSSTDRELMLCRDCSALLTKFCTADCTGTWRGNATYDSCGVCQPPATSGAVTFLSYVYTTQNYAYTNVRDCYGQCFGPFTNIITQASGNASNLPSEAELPQCGCVPSAPSSLQLRAAYPWTTLCSVWQKTAGWDSMTDSVHAILDYQSLLLALAILGLVAALSFEGRRIFRQVLRRMKMTPAEREREQRRRERRRQRERERRERRRALAMGMPLPGQPVLAPGQAATQLLAAPLPENLASGTDDPSNTLRRRNAATTAATNISSSPDVSEAESRALTQLASMGFTDTSTLLPLIRRSHGDINAVLNQLLR